MTFVAITVGLCFVGEGEGRLQFFAIRVGYRVVFLNCFEYLSWYKAEYLNGVGTLSRFGGTVVAWVFIKIVNGAGVLVKN